MSLSTNSTAEMPPKCRCGSGDMKLFTCHTKSNPNRKFWRCPRWNVSVLTCHAECAHFNFFYLFKTCLRHILMKTFARWNLLGLHKKSNITVKQDRTD